MRVAAQTGLSALPYPGLRPFRRDEADIFFGRERQVDQLLKKLQDCRFLAVVGTSGCGKSSLVRAGMLAALEAGFMARAGPRWHVAAMRPGSQPLQNLAQGLLQSTLLGEPWSTDEQARPFLVATLRRGPLGLVEVLREALLPERANLLLLVDQFEEIFRFHAHGDSSEATAFVDLLLKSAQHEELSIYVVITMRSDFLGDCSLFAGLPEAINDGQFLIPRLTRDQCRAAIVGPAAVFGGGVEDNLVAHILNDMGTDPDQLPLMQHALMRVWTRAADAAGDGRGDKDGPGPPVLLTAADYEAAGGLKAALSNHADEAYGELNPADQRIAELLFRCLSERGTDQRDTRRPTPLQNVAQVAGVPAESVMRVVEVFRQGDCSFLTPPIGTPLQADTILDISHESLIRQWQRMKRWVRDEADSASIYRRLSETARLWQAGQAALWGTPDLENALAWRQRERTNAAWAARYGGNFDPSMQFLDASVEARDRQVREQEQQRERELQLSKQIAETQKQRADEAEQRRREQAAANTRLRFRALVATGAGVVAILLAGIAFVMYFNAQLEKNRATSAQLDAEQQKAVAERAASNEKLAREVAEAAQAQALLAAESDLTARRIAEAAEKRALNALTDVRNAQQETATALARAEHNLYLNQISLAEREWDRSHTSKVVELLNGCSENFRHWEWYRLDRLCRLDELTIRLTSGNPQVVAWSPDGKHLVTYGTDGLLTVWNAETGSADFARTIAGGRASGAWQPSAVWAPDSKRIGVTYRDGTLQILDAATGEEVHSAKGHDKGVTSLDWSRTGAKLASAAADGTVKIWSAALHEEPVPIQGAGSVSMVRWSPDELQLATIAPGRIAIWDAGTGESRKTLPIVDTSQMAIAWSPQGNLLAVAGQFSVRIWDTESWEERYEFQRTGSHPCVAWSVDGRWVVTNDGATAIAFDLTTRSPVLRLQGHSGDVTGIALRPDGPQAVTASGDGTLKIWSTEPLATAQVLTHRADGRIVAWSPDGKYLATTGRSGVITLRTPSGAEVRSLGDHGEGGSFDALVWSPDARYLAAADAERKTVVLWEVESGEQFAVWSDLADSISSLAWHPAGNILALGRGRLHHAGRRPGVVELRDTATGKLLRSLEGHEATVAAMAWSPDGRRLATSSYDQSIRLWSLDDAGQVMPTVLKPTEGGTSSRISCVAWSPDGKYLTTGDWDDCVIWEIAGGESTTLSGHTSGINAICWSPDGQRLATAASDKLVIVWDPATHSEVTALKFGERVTSVSWSPSGARLAAGSYTQLRIWESTWPASRNTAGGPVPEKLVDWGIAARVTDTPQPAARPADDESSFPTRITSVLWNGQSFQPEYRGSRPVEEQVLGPLQAYADGLAMHPDGRIAYSAGGGTSPNMQLTFWNADGNGEAVVEIHQVPSRPKTNEERDEYERKGLFWFFGGPLTFDDKGTCYFSLGNCSPNGIFKVKSPSPVEIKKLYRVQATRSLQVPFFDPDGLYSTSWNGITRYAKNPEPDIPSETNWFRLQGDRLFLVDTLVLSPDEIIANISFQMEAKPGEKDYFSKAIYFNKESQTFADLELENSGPMALSWDGKRILRADTASRSIKEFSFVRD